MKIATMTAVPSTRPVIISRGFRVPLWLALPLFYGAAWLMAMAFPGGEPGKMPAAWAAGWFANPWGTTDNRTLVQQAQNMVKPTPAADLNEFSVDATLFDSDRLRTQYEENARILMKRQASLAVAGKMYKPSWSAEVQYRALQTEPWGHPATSDYSLDITLATQPTMIMADGDVYYDSLHFLPHKSGHWNIRLTFSITPYEESIDSETGTVTRTYGEPVSKPVKEIGLISYSFNLVVDGLGEGSGPRPNEINPGARILSNGDLVPVLFLLEPSDMPEIGQWTINACEEAVCPHLGDGPPTYCHLNASPPCIRLLEEDQAGELHEIRLPYQGTRLPSGRRFWLQGKQIDMIKEVNHLWTSLSLNQNGQNRILLQDDVLVSVYGLNLGFNTVEWDFSNLFTNSNPLVGCLVPLAEANHQDPLYGHLGQNDSRIDRPRRMAGRLKLSWNGTGGIRVWRRAGLFLPWGLGDNNAPWIEIANGESLLPENWFFPINSSLQTPEQDYWGFQFKVTGTKAGTVDLTAAVELDPILFAQKLQQLPVLDRAMVLEEEAFALSVPLLNTRRLEITRFDIDIDADRDGILSHSAAEEEAEENGIGMALAGGDSDNDGIPDYADGFDVDGIPFSGDETSAGLHFIPVTITLPAGIPISQMSLRLTYNAADPARIWLSAPSLNDPQGIPLPLTPEGWEFIRNFEWGKLSYEDNGWAKGNHVVRLWTKDGDAQRDLRSFLNGGDFVPSNPYDPAGYDSNTLVKLGFSDLNRTVTFYLEPLGGLAGAGDVRLEGTVLIHPAITGERQPIDSFADRINLQMVEVDLDVDSNNLHEIYPEFSFRGIMNSLLEERLEDLPGSQQTPGGLVVLATGDSDGDGIPDYADGFDLETSNDDDTPEIQEKKELDDWSNHLMTPVMLRFGPIDMAKATLRLDYPDSNPAGVTFETRNGVRIYKLPADSQEVDPKNPAKTVSRRRALRLWRGGLYAPFAPYYAYPREPCSRNKNSLLAADNPGDYLPAGTYSPAALQQLGGYQAAADGKPAIFSAILWLEGVRPSEATGDCRIVVHIDPDGPNGPLPETEFTDAIRIMVVNPIDLDIDSNNDGLLSPDDDLEDQAEAGDLPGKRLAINNQDQNKNGIPDYADCSSGHPTGLAKSLVPMRLRVTLPPGKTWDACALYIDYPNVSPALRRLNPDGSIEKLEPGTAAVPGDTYLPPETDEWTGLRLWTKNGKYVEPGYYSRNETCEPVGTLDDLGIDGDSVVLEFWVEGCADSGETQRIFVGLWDVDSCCSWGRDQVNVTPTPTTNRLDLDVDSDNSGTLDGSDAEDDTEDIAGQPGKIIPLGNDADADNDGVPDFADGFDLEPEGRRDSAADKLDKVRDNQSIHGMIPIVLRLPDDIDLETAVLRLDYDASTLGDVGVKIDRKDKRTYTLPPEAVVADPQDPTRKILMRRILRLWREKQDGQGKSLGLTVRNKASVLDKAEGSYVSPGAYSKDKLARLGFKKGTPDGNTVTLWLEGVRASLAPGDCLITVSLDPDGEGPLPGKNLEDAVRVTVMSTGIIPDWNRDGIINLDDQGKVTATTPWRIWKNDDLDKTTAASGILENNGVDLPGAKDGDGQDLVVNGIRDLVDFFPFFLDVGKLRKTYPFEEYQYKLRYPGTLHAFCGEPGLGLSAANVGALHKDIGIAEALKNRRLALVNADGLLLDPEFLAQPEPVIFIEGVEAGSGYLELVVAKQGTTVFSTRLPLQVCDVLQMFFRKDLCVAVSNALDGTGDCPVPSRLPFFTARDNWLVMVHGYDVNADNALMCFAETYKRFFHSGSNARYCGVNWHGRPASTTIGPTSYHQAVVNAFATAPSFARFVNELPGTRTVIGHSLGNMVVGAAICLPQNPAQVSSYIALDAAVAKEAWGDIVMPEDLAGSPLNDKGFFIDPNAWAYNVPIDSLGTWPELVAAGGGQLLASEWHRLFDANDRRSQLTWRNRFKELTARTTVYNFYSSTEDVVGNLNDGSLLSDKGLLESTSYAWHKQEKLKGRRYVYNVVPGGDWENLGNCMSDFCGWSASPYYRQFQDESLNGLGWIFAMGKNAASISGFLSGSISELNAAKQRFQEFDWIQTPIDIIMTTLGAINSVLTNTWSFLTGNLSSAAKKSNVLEIRFKDPQDLLKATIQPRAVQTMARVQAMADSMSKKENKPVTVKELLKTQPYFAVDSGLYLKYFRLFRKPRFQNLTETIGGTTPSKFLESRASTIKDITEYY